MAEPIPIELQIEILGEDVVRDVADYIGLVYQYLVGIAAIFAIAMIMWGGMKWIFAGGDAGKIGTAKETITNAVVGLILALGSFLLLNTINPALVNLEMPGVKIIKPIPLATVGFCDNTGSFEGKYPCGRVITLNNESELKELMQTRGFTGETCVGASCSGNEGCFYSTQVAKTRNRAPFLCLDETACGNTCGEITDKNLCDSAACWEQVDQRCWWKGGECKPRKRTATDRCNADEKLPACGDTACGDLTCADFNAICTEVGDNRCVPRNSFPSGAECERGDECQSNDCEPGTGTAVTGAVIMGGIVGVKAGAVVGTFVPIPILGTVVGAATGAVAGGATGLATYYGYMALARGTCR